MQALPADEPRIDLVPIQNAGLAQFPAVEDVAPFDLSAKINESGSHPLADDAQVVELGNITFDIDGKALRLRLEQLGDCVGMLGAGADGRQLEFADFVFPEFM